MRLIEFFDRGYALGADATAFCGEGGTYTYRQTSARTHAIARALRAHGADEATSISILTPNDVRGLICLLGIHRLGGTYARLNFRAAIDENIHILRRARAHWLFFHSAAAAQIPALTEAVPDLRHVVCIDAKQPGYPSLDELAASHEGNAPPLEPAPDHVAMLASTGGTTGKPKLVMLTDLNFETAVMAQLTSIPCAERPTYLIASAMTHAASTIAYGLLSQGARVIVAPSADALLVMRTIERERVTHLYLPPTAIYSMLAHPEVHSFDYSSLRYFIYSAAPISAAKLALAIDSFGPVMTQFYGQAECPMFISVLTPADHAAGGARLLSCGRPTPYCTVAVIDEHGALLPQGQRGEIVTRGKLVMKGYLDDDAATREASAHGWHHTGDIGYFDAQGYLYLVDRKKDLIISGGFNVFPGEVEQALSSHPAVEDCAVVGAPHEKWGEEVRAVVQLRTDANASAESLIAHCKERVGSIKAPKVIEFWPSLPKSAAGKVLRREVRNTYWRGHERII
jgi:acyl-CoA synthetase (AMP-forming)/AMP-acid ligase II